MTHHHYPIDRRQLLVGVAALAAFAPFAGARGETVRISDLVDGAGAALPRGRALAGATVTLRGYLAPIATRDGIGYALSESPAGPCPLCGELHEPGAALRVEAAPDAPSPASLLQVVTVTGRIAIDDGIARLCNARFA